MGLAAHMRLILVLRLPAGHLNSSFPRHLSICATPSPASGQSIRMLNRPSVYQPVYLSTLQLSPFCTPLVTRESCEKGVQTVLPVQTYDIPT